jgi:polyhydroxyalkanoate synthesis regulator phasin
MTRSSTEYRLAEREIAEAFCEMHHIPTRTEMDEMQRVVTELRREIRALKKAPQVQPSSPPRRRGPNSKARAKK